MGARVMSISQESCTALCSSHLLTPTSLRRFGWTTSWGPLRGPTERTSSSRFARRLRAGHRASFIAHRPAAIGPRARHSQTTISGRNLAVRKPCADSGTGRWGHVTPESDSARRDSASCISECVRDLLRSRGRQSHTSGHAARRKCWLGAECRRMPRRARRGQRPRPTRTHRQVSVPRARPR